MSPCIIVAAVVAFILHRKEFHTAWILIMMKRVISKALLLLSVNSGNVAAAVRFIQCKVRRYKSALIIFLPGVVVVWPFLKGAALAL